MNARLVAAVICALGAPASADYDPNSDPNYVSFAADDPYEKYAAIFHVHAGAMLVDYEGESRGGGPIAGFAFRFIDPRFLKNDVVGLVVVTDCDLGYATELVGQLRGGAGLGVVRSWFSASAFGGGAVGSMGRAASVDGFVGGNVGITGRSEWTVWAEAARAYGKDGPNHDRFELRILLPDTLSDPSWSWFVGARYLGFPDLNAGTGAALLVTGGVGVGAGHIWVGN